MARSAAGTSTVVRSAPPVISWLLPALRPDQPGLLRQRHHHRRHRRHLDRLHVGTFTGPTGLFRQRTELSKPQRDQLAKLDITPPKQMIELTPTSP